MRDPRARTDMRELRHSYRRARAREGRHVLLLRALRRGHGRHRPARSGRRVGSLNAIRRGAPDGGAAMELHPPQSGAVHARFSREGCQLREAADMRTQETIMPSRLSIVAAVAATLIMIPVLASAQGFVGAGGGGGGGGPAGGGGGGRGAGG